jgi:hypothetical protein
MTSSFVASLFAILFLVMSSLHSTTKIVSYGTDAKQEQIVPARAFPSNTDDMTSPLPSRRQPWSTVISSVDPSLSSSTIVTPVSASLIWNMTFYFSPLLNIITLYQILYLTSFPIFSSNNANSILFLTVELEMNALEIQLSLRVNVSQQHLLLRPILI